MLIICPECSAKISAEADPCPKCGFPEAGRKSKKFNELLVSEDIEKFVNETLKMPYKNEAVYPGFLCDKCGYCFTEGIKVKKIKRKLVHDGVGYGTRWSFKCPKCGGTVENIFAN